MFQTPERSRKAILLMKERDYIVSDLVKEKVDFEMLLLTSPPSVC